MRWTPSSLRPKADDSRKASLGILPVVLVVTLAFLGLMSLHAGQAPAAELKKEEPAAATPSAPLTYVGSETCQACHEDIFKGFANNPHHTVEVKKARGFEGKACESCHGPGSKHADSASADDIINPAKQKAGVQEKICLTCHKGQPTTAGRIMGGHGRNQVGCVSCHSVHAEPAKGVTPGSVVSAFVPRANRTAGGPRFAARATADVNAQCASCHTNVWAQFQRPHRHPVPEGGMSCVDCHNPHGSQLPGMTRTVSANEPGCLKCHGDKRGPFTFEHAPVRMEGCNTCHQAHGSANPKMLTRHEVRFQCLECHSNLPLQAGSASGVIGGTPPAFHDIRNPRYQNCTVCHLKVHGSYANKALLR